MAAGSTFWGQINNNNNNRGKEENITNYTECFSIQSPPIHLNSTALIEVALTCHHLPSPFFSSDRKDRRTGVVPSTKNEASAAKGISAKSSTVVTLKSRTQRSIVQRRSSIRLLHLISVPQL